MMKKDYYAILMVHKNAEQFLIEAAYRRLAREYHPDVSRAQDAHYKMVDVNEAYEVLSDPVRRKLYDEEYARRFDTRPKETHIRGSHTRTASTATPPRNATGYGSYDTSFRTGEKAPVPPNPVSFGIDPNYLERAIEGARLWNERKPRIPEEIKWALRAVCVISGVTIMVAVSGESFEAESSILPAFISLIVAEVPIRVIEAIHDSRLLKSVYNPKYNPNPEGYKKYAEAYAEYESSVSEVYVSRNWLYHSNKFCSGMMSYEAMPKWKATAIRASPCQKCGYFSMRPKILPAPFGRGYLHRYTK
jgi:hypothetical protein